MAAKKKPGVNALTVDLPLTSKELEMLRDIFGVVMPIMAPATATENEEPAGVVMAEATIAEYLAAISDRTKLEHTLWKKVAKACAAVGVVTGKQAPTFAVSAAHIPAMHVYKLEE